MRSFGHARGNATLQFMIGQTARRRLWAQLGPAREGLEGAEAGAGGERWTRAFYERLDETVRTRFARIETLAEGELTYLGAPSLQLWGLRAEYGLVLALDHEDGPQQILDRARRWTACLTTRTAPGLASPHWGHPVYGARIDPRTHELDVVWAFTGDWCELAVTPPERQWDRPDHWRVSEGPAR